MKYLKKFNEELRSQTYCNAARKLDKKGFTDRSKALKDWAIEVEKKEEMVKWKENIKDFAPFGTFKMTIKNPETGDQITGDFHFDIVFDELSFSEEPESGMFFHIGLIPTSEDLINEYIDLCDNYEFGNGFFWGKMFSLQYELDDTVQFTKWIFEDYDPDMNGEISFTDRASANKFKNLLIKIFSDPELGYPSGYTDADDIYEKMTNCILAEKSFSSEYGFKLQDAADYIRTISPNSFNEKSAD